MNRMPELVIFDLDGTLVPTMQGFADIAAGVIADRWGWPVAEARQAYLATSGVPFFEQLEILFPGDSENAEAADEFERRKETFFHDVEMDRPVRAALQAMRKAGLRLAVSSNNFARLVRDMIHRETPGVFDEVCGYRPNFAKGPDHFHWLQERFAVTADHCLFVGDSLSDLEKAHKAGMPFVGVTGTFRRSTFQELDPAVRTISSVAELPSALDRQPVVAEPAMLGVAV